MGHTHHWQFAAEPFEGQWREALAQVPAILAEATHLGIALDNESNDRELVINGVGSEACEPFRMPVNVMDRSGDWTFCKTYQRPYDAVVVAILATLQALAPDCIEVHRAHIADDLEAGLALARIATGLEIPSIERE